VWRRLKRKHGKVVEALLHHVGVLRRRWMGRRRERSPNQAKRVFHSCHLRDSGFGAEHYVTQLEKEEPWLVKSVVAEDSEPHQEFEDEWAHEPDHRWFQTVAQSHRVQHHRSSSKKCDIFYQVGFEVMAQKSMFWEGFSSVKLVHGCWKKIQPMVRQIATLNIFIYIYTPLKSCCTILVLLFHSTAPNCIYNYPWYFFVEIEIFKCVSNSHSRIDIVDHTNRKDKGSFPTDKGSPLISWINVVYNMAWFLLLDSWQLSKVRYKWELTSICARGPFKNIFILGYAVCNPYLFMFTSIKIDFLILFFRNTSFKLYTF